ncbi:hypothetical protein ACAY42_000247 [Citrobacter freundii]|uniref:hypothetical protein n=1 Tax=Citrobacter freundii complex TaxID=1344959 RepID=UPI000CDCE989|nr:MULTISPECIES: hypothetical protein [Citrobacter freundii complex]EMA2416335.1 hypothetical protein [Citrobacter freundii]MBE9969124.1 hypothetical protein [Citrobacter freundii]MBE9976426.1 hypothetical protein [Citrobacter freundii]MBE9985769.1 hypothetical protein [Citrobacter freundii]MBF0065137.1 hypothetical protein [Citrobacter freundii]
MKTFTIGWLNKCRCGNKSHSVKTARGNESALWDDDAVKCNSCGRGGVIQVCEGQARVLWETNEEMAEGKPMSTITKERIANLLQFNSEGSNCQANAEQWEVHELARIALASLEAEPAIHRWRRVTSEPYGPYPWHYGDFIGFSKPVDGIEDEYFYTAPPAPVSVPDAMEMDDDFDSAFEHGKAVGWNAYRAAMLQGAEQPQSAPQNIPENIPVTLFKPVADLYGLTSPTGSETSFTFDAVEARDFIDGGWSCQEYVELERFQEAITNHTEDKLAMVDHSGDSNNMVEPVTKAYKLPPHIYRELVNRLRDTAAKYHGCQQLREQLSHTLQEVIQPAAPKQEVK